jgi:disulfide bond formation protein DsbB
MADREVRMTRNQAILLAAGGSLALLAGAFLFQALGYAPCKLCLWQRWPHAGAIALGLVALVLPGRIWPALGALAALTTAVLGLYHTGVERGWWLGPDTCTSGPIGGLSAEDLLAQIEAAPLVRCDEVAWQLAGLSMASWNAILSLVLVALWLVALRRPA